MEKPIIAKSDDDDVSVKELSEFFKAKNVKRECEICGSGEWSVATQVDGARPRLFFRRGDPDEGMSGNISLFLANCDNCGNVRIFNRYYLDAWLLSERDEEESDG